MKRALSIIWVICGFLMMFVGIALIRYGATIDDVVVALSGVSDIAIGGSLMAGGICMDE